MKIWEYINKSSGSTAEDVLKFQHDKTATLADVQEALYWACVDGKAERIGRYYWRRDG